MAPGSAHAKASELHSIDLLSKQIYDKIEFNYTDLSNYSQKCDNIYVNKNKDEVKTICEKLLRYLEKSTALEIANPQYDICLILNYWIYDKLNKIFGDKETSDKAFGNFQMIWNYLTQYINKNISYYEKCKENLDIHKQEDWEKRKELYDYCIDYNTLYGTATNYGDKCEDYYEYIEQKTSLYTHFEDICSTEENRCPTFYKDCKQYNPDIVLSKFRCHNEMLKKKAIAQPRVLQQESASGHNSLDSGLPEAVSGSPKADHLSETSQIGKKVGHSILGIGPVVLTATALYRYTPIGTWFRNLGGTNPNSMSNINEGEMDGFFGDSENYISYQAM
ncbi:PIR Superfamily Protein [Plasmodium ovale wallikeri]|uniref:PIR Superfamily Protein n=2 Tax=Plasmodium ovale TaxID=36330 RepID=A0A1A9AMY5_PLAOA|nr:PIR Superfamily Protein [Plasmodium ovale wallikeri]SBT57551.1 PIR Superfamily Protein [Plasmodium ovale wallikeri]SBT72687.1 Plasmodium vivax Vir protein, putative [Plasmodium ovale]